MSNLARYVDDYFDSFEMKSDLGGEHFYKDALHGAIDAFLEKADHETTFDVYKIYFACYRIQLMGESTDHFIDLLDMLLEYEEYAGGLLDRQRDHYVHSVNVFLLGLSIFSQNKNFKRVFAEVGFSGKDYEGRYDCVEEEFLFRWGIAALFHDMGYPVQITYKQLKRFLDLVANVDGENDPRPFLDYGNFKALKHVKEFTHADEFVYQYLQRHPDAKDFDLNDSVELLSYGICRSLKTDTKKTKEALDGFLKMMQEGEFIDHGFYSAIIILKWYAFLIQRTVQSPDVFYGPILDAATAIFLHTAYKKMFQKKPFKFRLDAMSPESLPISYLLLLCDNLQEWNRTVYASDVEKVFVYDVEVTDLENNGLNILYNAKKAYEENLGEGFVEKKKRIINGLLKLDEIFTDGVDITCTTFDPGTVEVRKQKAREEVTPRIPLEDIEALARVMHEHDDSTWADLPPRLKYASLKQARLVFENVEQAGYEFFREGQAPLGWEEVLTFSDEDAKVFDYGLVKNVIPFLNKMGYEIYIKKTKEK